MSESAVEQQPMLTDDQLNQISKEDLVLKWRELRTFTNNLQARLEQTQSDHQKNLVRAETIKSLEIAKLKNIILKKCVANSKENQSTVRNRFTQVLMMILLLIHVLLHGLFKRLVKSTLSNQKKDRNNNNNSC